MPKPVPVTLPYAPWSHPTDEWLCHSMKSLHLQPTSHESRSRAWWNDAPTLAEEKLKKQVWFDVDEELGNDATLPLGLILFLAPLLPCLWDSSWPSPSEGPQHHPTYLGGAWPKAPAKPSAGWSWSWPWSRPKEGPDLINHPHQWVVAEMNRFGSLHPHW